MSFLARDKIMISQVVAINFKLLTQIEAAIFHAIREQMIYIIENGGKTKLIKYGGNKI